MTVDLKNAKAGDKITVVLDEDQAHLLNKDECLSITTWRHQITAIEPGPFNWNTAEPGMEFLFEGRSDQICYYIGKDTSGRHVFETPWRGILYMGLSDPDGKFGVQS